MSLESKRTQHNKSWADDEDIIDIILAHQYRLMLPYAPRQSGFRVVALIFYESKNEKDNKDSLPCLLMTPGNPSTAASTQAKSIMKQWDQYHRSRRQKIRRYVVGTNDEPNAIAGSICAERAALVQLRFAPKDVCITKIVIVTDSSSEISPGMLCREFLSSHPRMSLDTPIVLGGGICGVCGLDISGRETPSAQEDEGKGRNQDVGKDVLLSEKLLGCTCQATSTSDSDNVRVAEKKDEVGVNKQSNRHLVSPHDFTRIRTTIRTLYPHPSLYVRLNVTEAVQFGKLYASSSRPESSSTVKPLRNNDVGCIGDETFTRKVRELMKNDNNTNEERRIIPNDMAKQLLELAVSASQRDNRSDVYSLQYGSAVLFSDGTFATSYQKKALEYGCTLDAVGQLAHVIEERACKNGDDDDGDEEEGEENATHCSKIRKEKKPVRPILVVQADQYGIAHAPFAPGRAYLSEHGHRDCHVLLHSTRESGSGSDVYHSQPNANGRNSLPELQLLQVRVDQLVQDIPNMGGGILNCACDGNSVSRTKI